MFIDIHDRVRDLDIQLSGAVLETYKEEDIKDIDGTVHLCIFYKLRNGLRFEEEFTTAADREDKMALLDEWSSGGGGGGSNLQVKSITVTENGNSTVNPDAGYDGMLKVNLTTNVQPDLESKSITITTNGTTTVSPTQGKDGLSSVEITTNVSGNANNVFVDTSLPYDTSYGSGIKALIKTVDNIDTSNMTNLSNMFSACRGIETIPNINTSKATNMSGMFSRCTILKSVPNMDTPNVTNMSSMFSNCWGLKSIPQLDTKNVTNMSYMFSSCSNLMDVPLLNTSKVTNVSNMFDGASKLTDASLDNILVMCINAVSYTGTKTLSSMGFRSNIHSSSRIQALPHYQDFLSAGWTIGY